MKKDAPQLAYEQPLLMLPFDHRSSFIRDLLGFSGQLTAAQKKRVSEMKRVVYEGFEHSAPKKQQEQYAILADDEYSGSILRDARKAGYRTAMPVEKSGQHEFSFDSPQWKERIKKANTSIVKVLVRYNPSGDKLENRRQLRKLKQLSNYCRELRKPLLFELLVPPTTKQVNRYPLRMYDAMLRPELVAQAIKEIQKEVSVDIWKIEGMSKQQWKPVIAASKPNARGKLPVFIVLGRNAPQATVDRWLRAGAAYPEVVGFAVGRTIFYRPLEEYRDGALTRAQAAKKIGESFKHFARVWRDAKKD